MLLLHYTSDEDRKDFSIPQEYIVLADTSSSGNTPLTETIDRFCSEGYSCMAYEFDCAKEDTWPVELPTDMPLTPE